MSGFLDRVINVISPKWAANRAAWRELQAAAVDDNRRSYSRLRSRAVGRPSESEFLRGPNARRKANDYVSREEARDLAATNPVGERMVDTMTAYLVGHGIVPRSDARTMAADAMTGNSAPVAKVYDAWFDEWAQSADVLGRSLWDVQRELASHAYIDGEVFLLLLGVGKVQVIPACRVASPTKRHEADADAVVEDGIVLDPIGAPVAFYVCGPDKEFVRYPAADVVHWVFRRDKRQPMAVRGVPAFQSTYDVLHSLAKYNEAVVVAARIAACFGLVIKQQNAGFILQQLRQASTGPSDEPAHEKIQPGQIMRLQPGEDIGQVAPTQPSQNHSDVIRTQVRLCGLPDGMPLEVALLDFSQSNMSAARAALLQFQKALRPHLDALVYGLLNRLWRWRIAKAIKASDLPPSDDYAKVTWTPPAWGYLDPSVERQADQQAIDMGQKTRRQVAREQNTDFDANMREQGEELKVAAAYGVTLSRSTATRDSAAAPLPMPQAAAAPQGAAA